jgi:uncharacterized membrane protein YeaQ/YmgE (transglycosylase-associated protein family)
MAGRECWFRIRRSGPLRVKSGHPINSRRCPLYPQKRTSELGLRYVRRNSSGSLAMSTATRWTLKNIRLSGTLTQDESERAMSILWTIIIGFVAGVIAKFLYPGDKYEPTGYIWTTVLGIIGAFVATYLGQAVGWYQAGEGAGFIGAIVGAVIVLFVWGFIAPRFERT